MLKGRGSLRIRLIECLWKPLEPRCFKCRVCFSRVRFDAVFDNKNFGGVFGLTVFAFYPRVLTPISLLYPTVLGDTVLVCWYVRYAWDAILARALNGSGFLVSRLG